MNEPENAAEGYDTKELSLYSDRGTFRPCAAQSHRPSRNKRKTARHQPYPRRQGKNPQSSYHAPQCSSGVVGQDCTQPPCLATLSRDVFPDSAAPSDVRHYGRVERARSAASRRAFRKHRMATDRASRRCPLIHTTSYAAVEKSTMLRSISFVIQQPTHGRSYWVRTRRQTLSRAQ